MTFFETPVFTRKIVKLISDDEYRALQRELIANPAGGDLIKSSGGIRKIRCRAGAQGKSGGVRLIYYWLIQDQGIFMLTAYGKNEKDDLSAEELKLLRRLVCEELK
jgi:hypothetical protein